MIARLSGDRGRRDRHLRYGIARYAPGSAPRLSGVFLPEGDDDRRGEVTVRAVAELAVKPVTPGVDLSVRADGIAGVELSAMAVGFAPGTQWGPRSA